MNIIHAENLTPPPFNEDEILRYTGARNGDSITKELVKSCISELSGKLVYRVCHAEFKISKSGDVLDLGFTKTESRVLEKHLSECNGIVLFAATVGIELDRLIAKYSRLSPTRALAFQGIGAERVEALCDAFEEKIRSELAKLGKSTVKRVSAGYGDIPLEMHKDIFAVLDCPRRIGLSLNESLLMSPSKSVTAIIGIIK